MILFFVSNKIDGAMVEGVTDLVAADVLRKAEGILKVASEALGVANEVPDGESLVMLGDRLIAENQRVLAATSDEDIRQQVMTRLYPDLTIIRWKGNADADGIKHDVIREERLTAGGKSASLTFVSSVGQLVYCEMFSRSVGGGRVRVDFLGGSVSRISSVAA